MKNYQIITDTREQMPLWSDETKTLKIGDYSIKGHENNISIERKSLADLAGSLGKGHARFRKELEKAKKLQYFAIVIEGTPEQLETKNWPKSHFCQLKGYVLFKILCTLHIKHGINFFFGGTREGCRILIRNIFTAYLKKKEDEGSL